MYESPISKIMGEIQQQIIRDDENHLLYQVEQSVGYFVDKEELIKALNYDREQYQKGYHDGSDANKWIPVSEKLPEDFQRVLVTIVNYNEDRIVRVAEYYKWEGVKGTFHIKENHERWEVGEKGLLAWMPLPEPYRAESDG